MSEPYRQRASGRPTYIDASARASSSGHDAFNLLAAHDFFHHESQDRNPPSLQMASQDSYPQGQSLAYALHSSSLSLPGLPFSLPTTSPMSQNYEDGAAVGVGVEDLRNFSPTTPTYNFSAYRASYPDSNATSASSPASPDPTHATLMPDAALAEVDEDKRRRNQAASARFRQKKKQREQQLMNASREMQEKTKKLEAENDSLKKENRFLKKLLVEKVDHMSEEDRELLKKATETVFEASIPTK